MKIKSGDKIVNVTTNNWPMVADLFVKWGVKEELLEIAKENTTILVPVADIDRVTCELSAWDIPWKREY